MTEADDCKEDEVLKRMLKTPPKPHKSKKKGHADGDQKARDRRSK